MSKRIRGRKPGQRGNGNKQAAKTDRLTPKQMKFAQLYLKLSNASEAARQAGYSPRSAGDAGSRLLNHPKISAYIQEMLDKSAREAETDILQWLREVRRVALSDIRKLFDDDGNLKPPDQWDDDTAASVASVDVAELRKDDDAESRIIKARLHSKLQALDLWGRQLGAVKDHVEVTVVDLTGTDAG